MKKLIVGILIFIAISCIQILYIDFRLSQELNSMTARQKGLTNEIKRIELQTEFTSVKWNKTLFRLKSPESKPDMIFANQGIPQSQDLHPIAAVY